MLPHPVIAFHLVIARRVPQGTRRGNLLKTHAQVIENNPPSYSTEITSLRGDISRRGNLNHMHRLCLRHCEECAQAPDAAISKLCQSTISAMTRNLKCTQKSRHLRERRPQRLPRCSHSSHLAMTRSLVRTGLPTPSLPYPPVIARHERSE